MNRLVQQPSPQTVRLLLEQLLPAGPKYLLSATASVLGGVVPTISTQQHDENRVHVRLTYALSEPVRQDDCQIELKPGFDANDYWIFHLTPEEGNIAEQHVFRTPAVIARGKEHTLILLPDIEICDQQAVRSYMDMDKPGHSMMFGMSNSFVESHVIYRKASGATYPAGTTTLAFWLMTYAERLENPFRPVLDFYWSRYGSRDYRQCFGDKGDLSPYVRHTYRWAFESWKNVVWQEFELDGIHVGAPTFIVVTRQSPNFKGVHREREFRSIWNQAWFCSLRGASGLFRHARRNNRDDYMELARKTKELALAFPQRDGLFESVIATEMESFEADGETYNRSRGWSTWYFGNSNRNPFAYTVAGSPRHILDMSFTAWYMLIWYRDLERDERLAEYARAYAERLLRLQDDDGYFPGWLDGKDQSMGVLDNSPESAMSAAFLVACHNTFGDVRYLKAAERAMRAIVREIVPAGRYEDFETYWSCSRFWSDQVGEQIRRNGMHKQGNLSMYYIALALLELHEATDEAAWLEHGCRVLDELLMTQSSYQPRSIQPPVVGGFGVLNADGELNDARQSLFAELIYRYGEKTNNSEYRERALAALRVSFSMMYCPENPVLKKQWEIVWPFLGPEDYGFTMENYGHSGCIDAQGTGIGEFTIYDWGNGAASESYERMLDHYGTSIIEANGKV